MIGLAARLRLACATAATFPVSTESEVARHRSGSKMPTPVARQGARATGGLESLTDNRGTRDLITRPLAGLQRSCGDACLLLAHGRCSERTRRSARPIPGSGLRESFGPRKRAVIDSYRGPANVIRCSSPITVAVRTRPSPFEIVVPPSRRTWSSGVSVLKIKYAAQL